MTLATPAERPPASPGPPAPPTENRRSVAGWALGTGAVAFGIQVFISRYFSWDTFFNLVAGRYVAEHGIPRTEVLTLEGKETWIDQQWLAHWLYYETWRLGGYAAVAALSSLLVAAAFGLLTALLVTRGVPAQRAALWSTVAFVVALGNTIVRAQSFAFPLFVALLWILLDDAGSRTSGRRLLLAVPLLVLWANVHGTVLLAAATVVAYCGLRAAAMLRRARRAAGWYAAVGVASGLAVLANPYGHRVFEYYGALLGNRTVHRFILEWTAPSLAYVPSLGFFALLVGVAGVVGYALGRGYRPPLILLAGTVGLGLLASQGVRYQVWFGIVAATLAADALARVRPAAPAFAPRPLRLFAAAAAAFALLAGVVLATTPDRGFEHLVPHGAMAAVARHAEANPDARILADEHASALLWKHPQLAGRLGFDTRLEQYSDEELVRWFTYLNAASPGWAAITRRYDVLLASGGERPLLVRRLHQLNGWRPLYADAGGVAFVRVEVSY